MPDKINVGLTPSERAESIHKRVHESATTGDIIDWLLRKHPEWKDAERKRIRDALRTCNPHSVACTPKWRNLYERSLAQFSAEQEMLLRATRAKALDVISTFIERLREVRSVPIETAGDWQKLISGGAQLIRDILPPPIPTDPQNEYNTESRHDSFNPSERARQHAERY